MKLKTNTFEDKIRRKTRGIVLSRAGEAYIFTLLSIALLFYASLILAYFVPQIVMFAVPKKIVIAVFAAAPLAVALLIAQIERRDALHLTLKLEQHYPQLRDRLLTVVELGKADWVDKNPFSRTLARGLEQDMSELMDRFAFRGAISFKKMALPAAVFLMLSIAGSVHAMVQPDFFKVGFERLTHPIAENRYSALSNFFKKTLFEIHVVPGDSEIPRGSNLQVKAAIDRYVPKKIELYYKKSGERAWRIFPMDKTEEGDYEVLLTHLTEDASYYIRADHQESRVYQIKIFETLRIERASWKLEFPRYMNLTEQFRQGWKDKMTVPEGTKLSLEIYLNQEPDFAEMSESGASRKFKFKKLSPKTLAVDFTVSKDMMLTLDIRAKSGAVLDAPAVWVQALPDLAPYLEVLEPQPSNYVYPTQEIPFELSVNDDYGLLSVDLVIRCKGKQQRIHWLPQGPSPESAVLKPVLKLEDFNLESRDLVVAYIEVRDNYPKKDARHAVRSSNFSFLIRDYIEQYKINLPHNEEIPLRQRFEDILVDQEKIMQDTWDYISMPPLEGPKGWENPSDGEEGKRT